MPRANVLIVDDEPAIARCLATFLRGRGFHAETAGDAHAALERLADARWDIVVMDLRLGPGLRGDEVLRVAEGSHPGVMARSIFMTGDLGPEAQSIIAATGRPFYLRKPFSLALLLDAVRAQLAADRADQEREAARGQRGTMGA